MGIIFFHGNFQVHIFFEHFSGEISKPDFSKSSNLISTRLLISNKIGGVFYARKQI